MRLRLRPNEISLLLPDAASAYSIRRLSSFRLVPSCNICATQLLLGKTPLRKIGA